MYMMSFIKKALWLFFFFITQSLSAQVEISGTVIDDYNSKPIDGAKIKVKGINAGAYTDQNGKFTISFNADFPIVLVSSILGYNDLEAEGSKAVADAIVQMPHLTSLK